MAEVLVASCTGCARLSEEVGLPLAHVDVVDDAGAALGALNACAHGSGFRIPRMFQPVIREGGWSDWARLLLTPAHQPMPIVPPGLWLDDGRLFVELSDAVTLTDLRAELCGALRHLRLQEFTLDIAYMAARSDVCADYIVHPRYTLERGFRTARLVEDLYVLDGTEQFWRLCWLVAAARLAATDRRGSAWM